MKELKTKKNNDSVQAFIDAIEDDKKKTYSEEILGIMKEITQEEPKMWGTSIVGFGSYHYVYESGREGDWFLTGFSPRKTAMTLYIMAGFGKYDTLLQQLGKYKIGKSCLYIKKLEDVDMTILKELIATSVIHIKQKYPT